MKMNSKNKIFKNLHKSINSNTISLPLKINDREVFKDYPANSDLVEMFELKFKALHGEFFLAENLEKAGDQLSTIISALENKKCISYSSKILNNLFSKSSDLVQYFYILDEGNLNSNDLASYEVGLTTADFLIARTGSIVLNSLSAGGRRISVLPPIHIVIATIGQIVYSLDDIFNTEFLTKNWSYATIISGPSRTSDIEKQLVLGAHGPKKLIVILVENL